MRYVKYIGEDEGVWTKEQFYPVKKETINCWYVINNGNTGILSKHEAVEITGFTKIIPTELMLESSVIEAYKQKALKLHEEGEIVRWEYLMVEAIKEGLK